VTVQFNGCQANDLFIKKTASISQMVQDTDVRLYRQQIFYEII